MSNNRYSRQSFLGEDSEALLGSVRIGIIGLGGGGSHIVQQLAHLGVLNYVIYDPDKVENSNLNRLVGATTKDEDLKTPKVDVAKRIIEGLQPKAMIDAFKSKWQYAPKPLRECDIIFGCVDSLEARREIEAHTRRYLIPYIDIGLDVNTVKGEPPIMAGQVVLSMPGLPCLKCLGFLAERKNPFYGDAGFRPQVVWANGILASLAVGISIDLITGWTKTSPQIVYLSYEGNKGTVQPHPRVNFVNMSACDHYPLNQAGTPSYRAV